MGHEIINLNGGKVETWTDGRAQVLCVMKDGNRVDVAIPDHESFRLAYAMSPAAGENFERARNASHALYELSYPATRAEELREIASEIGEPGCDDPCSDRKLDRGDFCRCLASENLIKLAEALELKAKVEAEHKERGRRWRWFWYRAFLPVWPRVAVRCLRPEEIPF